MNNQSINWLDQVKQFHQCGTLNACDTQGLPLILQWERVEGQDPRCTQIVQLWREILVPVYTAMELQFVQHYPHAVEHEMFLKPLALLLCDGVHAVDWQKAQEQLSMTFEQFFTTTNFAHFFGEQDVHFFVQAYEAPTKKMIGVIHFLVTPDFACGAVKVSFYGVAQTACHRGIEQLLMSSIFAIVDTITRIFLHTRSTNSNALALYASWGFQPCEGSLPYWTDVEYTVGQSGELEKMATSLK